MNILIKLIISWVVLALHANSVSALDLEDAGNAREWLVGNLSTITNRAGVYSTSSGTTVSGGSFSMRVPHKTYQLYSIDPPSMSAGCNGIDIHLGGISFISKEEALTMLRSIAQGTVTMTFLMAFKQACPMCAGALETAQEWAAKANLGGINTCQVSTALANNVIGEAEDAKNGACGTVSAETNAQADYLSAFSSADSECKKGSKEAVELLYEEYCDSVDGECRNLHLSKIIGVSTYEYLKTMNVLDAANNKEHMVFMELMLSLYGTWDNSNHIGNTLDAEEITDLLTCGVSAPGTATTSLGVEVEAEIRKTCKAWWEGLEKRDFSVLTCVKGKRGNISDYPCATTQTVDLREYYMGDAARKKILANLGFLENGYAMSFAATIENVIKKVKNKSSTELTPTEITLISAAPFPLYRLINLGTYFDEAVISAVLGDSIGAISADISVEMAKNLIGMIDKVNLSMSNIQEGASETMPEDLMKALKSKQEVHRKIGGAGVEMEAKAAMYKGLTDNISNLERAIMREQSGNLVLRTK